MRVGIEQEVTAVLDAMNEAGGYRRALVCTEDGLLIAAAGEGAELEAQNLAAFTSLFDTIVERAQRDLGSSGVDEVRLTSVRPASGPATLRKSLRPTCRTMRPDATSFTSAQIRCGLL